MFFVDLSSEFSTISPIKPNWNFNAGLESHTVAVTPPSLQCSKGDPPQSYVLSSLLLILYTYHCTASHQENSIIMFDVNTTIICHITNSNKLILGGSHQTYRKNLLLILSLCPKGHLCPASMTTAPLHSPHREVLWEPDPEEYKEPSASHLNLCSLHIEPTAPQTTPSPPPST